jgi:3-hydroxybutyryl-CoA dehydrogenase
MSRTEHIAVVGAGPIGNGIAQVFATKGHEVIFFDPDPQYLNAAIHKIRANLRLLAKNSLVHVDGIDPTIERIRLGKSLKETITGARFVVEAVADNLKLNSPSLNTKFKRSLFNEMEQYCSTITILASCETSCSISDIAKNSSISERIVGTHFWPPTYLVPLVEVVGGKDTLQEVTDYTCSLLRAVGKHPVLVNKDVPGLVGQRVQEALWRECQEIVEDGIASPEAVDEIIKSGFGIWLSALGPLENADIFGLDRTNKNKEIPHRYIERSLDIYNLFHVQSNTDGEGLGTRNQAGRHDLKEALIEKRLDAFFDQLIRWNQENNQAH